MAEDKGKNNGFRISNTLLTVLAILIGITLIAAVFVVPGYGKVFASYRAARSDYRSAQDALSEAQQANAELSQNLDELQTMTAETAALSGEVYTAAAKLEQDIKDGKSNKKICYITIDDGPYNKGKQFIELFDKYDIKATFFLTTANGNKLPDQADLTATSMYPEYLKHGHTIGNHSHSHNYSDGGIYTSAKAFMKDISKQQKFTQDATGGYTPGIVRFPGGMGMAGSKYDAIAEALRKDGLVWIDWTVDSGDSFGAEKATAANIKKNVLGAAKKQKIMVVLFHEWSKASLEAMPEIIEALQEQGYIFLPLSPESTMVQR